MRVVPFAMIFSLFLPCAVQRAVAQEKEPVHDGKAVSEWIARLKDKDDKVRLKAAMSLRQLGPEAKAAVPALLESLKDNSASVRCESAFALQRVGPAAKPAIPSLIEALKDADYHVRLWSLIALAEFGADARAAAPALASILKEPDIVLRAQAARGLWLMGEKKEEALTVLIDLLADKREAGVSSAAFVLADIGGTDAKRAVPALLKALERPEPSRPGRCGELYVRYLEINNALKKALKKIDPEAAKNVHTP
jgi:HEAT repeat protein